MLMQMAESVWREKLKANGLEGGEHTTGPCSFFMVKCDHPIVDAQGHCELCCGAGRITKGVRELHAKYATLSQTLLGAEP
jgi:hypothetical protein